MHLKVDIVGDMPNPYNPNFKVSLYLLYLSIFSSFLSYPCYISQKPQRGDSINMPHHNYFTSRILKGTNAYKTSIHICWIHCNNASKHYSWNDQQC